MNSVVTVRSLATRFLPLFGAVLALGVQACAGNDPVSPSGASQISAVPAFSLVPAPTITTNTNIWTTLAPMPAPRTAAAIELVSNQIYLMGGWDSAASARVDVYTRATNTWSTKPALPAARYEGNGAAEVGGNFYVAGGRNSLGVPTTTHWMFNKIKWTAIKPMPAPTACGTTLAVVTKLYVSGGCDATPGYKNNYYIYDKPTNAWTVATPSPSAHAFGAAGQLGGGALGLVGGYDSSGHVSATFEAYDPVSGTWTTRAPMPTPRARMWGRGVNGLFYVIGGVGDDGVALDVVEVYNPATDTWTAQAPMPTPRYGLGVMDLGHGDPNVQAIGGTDASGTVVGTNEMLTPGNIWASRKVMPAAISRFAAGTVGANSYIAGGVGATGALNTFRLFNGAWTTKAVLPQARYDGNGLDAIGNLLYVAGGTNSATGLPTKTLYAYSISGNIWTTKAAMPVASGCGATGAISGILYVTTGCDGIAFRTLLTAYTPGTNTWAARAPSTQSHVFPTSGVSGGKLYVAGGLDSNGVVTGTLEIYDPATDTWTQGAPMPVARYHATGRFVNGYLVVVGGIGVDGLSTDAVEIYDPIADTWETGVPMTIARNSMGAGFSGMQLMVFGGVDDLGTLYSLNDSYTP